MCVASIHGPTPLLPGTSHVSCNVCQGNRTVRETVPVVVPLPAGAMDELEIRAVGVGSQAPLDLAADFVFTVQVQSSKGVWAKGAVHCVELTFCSVDAGEGGPLICSQGSGLACAGQHHARTSARRVQHVRDLDQNNDF